MHLPIVLRVGQSIATLAKSSGQSIESFGESTQSSLIYSERMRMTKIRVARAPMKVRRSLG